MTAHACRRAFEKGQHERRAYPLNRGEYKLLNVIYSLKRDLEAMDAIRDHLLNRKRRPLPSLLVRCTSYDMAIWLKGLPEAIAHQFGHDVMPAIYALSGDDVPQLGTDAAVQKFTGWIDRYVDECETQRVRLKLGIKGEYASIKSGYSDLYGLITDGLRITRDALKISDNFKTSPSSSDFDTLLEIRLETL